MTDVPVGCLVVVTGARGRVGAAVCRALRAAGLRVAVVSRDAVPVTDADYLLVAPTLENVPPPPARPAAIFHLAAEISDPLRMWDVNVRGTEAILEWSRRYKVARFIYMSSVGVYGPQRLGTITPENRSAPANPYERSKARAEELVRAADREGRCACTVLQPSNVFGSGPGWDAPLLGFIRSVVRGLFCYVGSCNATFNYIDVRDVAAASVAALHARARGSTFILNDCVPLTRAANAVAAAAGVRPPLRSLPSAFAWPLAAALTVVAGVSGRRVPLDVARARELTNRAVYDGDEICAALDFAYPIGTLKGLADLVAHYRAGGYL